MDEETPDESNKLQRNPYGLNNSEQLEAYQADIDKERIEFAESLPDYEQEKFRAVEQALEILKSANVNCYMFALLPHAERYYTIDDLGFATEEIRKHGMIQYNTIQALAEMNESGKPTNKSYTEISYTNHSLVHCFMHMVAHWFPEPPPLEAVLQTFVITHLNYHSWAEFSVLPPVIQDLIDKDGPIFL